MGEQRRQVGLVLDPVEQADDGGDAGCRAGDGLVVGECRPSGRGLLQFLDVTVGKLSEGGQDLRDQRIEEFLNAAVVLDADSVVAHRSRDAHPVFGHLAHVGPFRRRIALVADAVVVTGGVEHVAEVGECVGEVRARLHRVAGGGVVLLAPFLATGRVTGHTGAFAFDRVVHRPVGAA
ncbi:hypothetical protein F5X71_29910 [Nocardia brasiliensis]|uniref:Uncharacterized protein n=1 Tax=Nocardia brasiliensis TaxID=37326 RepID=A0A6G9XYP0_NOCBR|nr:hypothetical protein F5X71_29910 [Nocardia brasiliensis]